MTVMSVSEVYSQASTPAPKENSVMGKEDFLTLLVAQLQHQDPLNPADGTEFTAQLAQFSSLEELKNINDTLSKQDVYQSTLNNIQSTNFIGKTVTATGDMFTVNDGSASPIQFDLKNDADSVYLKIYDQFGTFITDIDAGFMHAGEQQVVWDGRNAEGTIVPDGAYTFTTMAMKTDGSPIDSTSYTTGTVTGVEYASGDTYLLIEDNKIPIVSVIRIAEASDPKGL